MKDMDTSILNTLSLIAPDLMEEMELRTLILERVAALEPIGRRALAARLHLAEREVRAAAEALKRAGCLTQSASGMELTPQGQSLVEAARTVSSGRRTLSGIELSLSQMLGVERVCVVHGDADIDSGVMEEVARAAARQIRFLLQDAHVMAVTGGRTVAKTAEAITVAAPMEITVVPAQGGMGGGISTQANTVAERFAQKLGGYYRFLHLPDGLSEAAADELARLPQVRKGTWSEAVRRWPSNRRTSGGRTARRRSLLGARKRRPFWRSARTIRTSCWLWTRARRCGCSNFCARKK